MTTVILFVFGTILGSFLNVVILRWDKGVGSFRGRSACVNCAKTLRWWELLPIISFIALRARCARCKAGISWQYPLVEILAGLVFVTVPYIFLPVFCIYIVIAAYDYRTQIIPDPLVYASIVLSLLINLFSLSTISTLDWLAGPALFAFFASIWLVTSGRAIGFGDAKLGLSIGLLLGASVGFSGIIVSFWLGALFGLILILIKRTTSLLSDGKKITMKSAIPFAPFMIVGAWLALILQLDLLHVSPF